MRDSQEAHGGMTSESWFVSEAFDIVPDEGHDWL
jgi:hypothetical protein